MHCHENPYISFIRLQHNCLAGMVAAIDTIWQEQGFPQKQSDCINYYSESLDLLAAYNQHLKQLAEHSIVPDINNDPLHLENCPFCDCKMEYISVGRSWWRIKPVDGHDNLCPFGECHEFDASKSYPLEDHVRDWNIRAISSQSRKLVEQVALLKLALIESQSVVARAASMDDTQAKQIKLSNEQLLISIKS
ncbi:hypothetical protein ACN1T8_001510 [Vibrio cholerae]|uniref:hypothetical protein n=2 Tax=Vibrio cholerae TaxID=666 RepID=UPI001A322EDF|nr:hypothetical protein [Vibrio cholerae]MCR9658428.1 hypothetical protein [Vibrio cholerae]MCR9689110.1 hypothetical protein [Vibrio cholerae]MCR9746441.1 hypothetical protein [Vibrio cholerae]HAS7809529.1 hypothetical protein [Vibrio cholerae]